MNEEEFHVILHSNICECETKLELIRDYLQRFQILDSRLVAPIFDVHRCVEIMMHVIHDHDSGNTEFSDNGELME